MSRRQTNHSSFRFKGRRSTNRKGHQDSRWQSNDRNQDTRFDNREFSERNDRNQDTRFDNREFSERNDLIQDSRFDNREFSERNDRSQGTRVDNRDFNERDDYDVDRHGEYHRAVLIEDFNDSLIDDLDHYRGERYNVDSYNDRNQSGAYVEPNSGRFQGSATADDRYISDAYDQNNSYRDGLNSHSDAHYDRYDQHDKFDDRNYGEDNKSNYDQENYYSNQRYAEHLDDSTRDTGFTDSSRNEDYRHEDRSNYKIVDQRNYKNDVDRRFNKGIDKKKEETTFQRPKERTFSSERQHKTVVSKERSKSQDDKSSHARRTSCGSSRHEQHKSRSKERDSKRTSHSSSDTKNKCSHKSGSSVSKGKQQVSKSSTKQTSYSSKLKDSKHGKPSHVSSSKVSVKESNTPRKHASPEKGKSSGTREKYSKKNNVRDSLSRSNNNPGIPNGSPQKKPVSVTPTRKRTVSNENRKRVDSGTEHFERSSISRNAFDGKSDHGRQRSTGRGSEVAHREDEVRHHDDDVLSIFADDDRFYWETNTLLEARKNNDRTESKDGQWDKKENRQYYTDDYTLIDDRGQYDNDTRLRSSVVGHSHRNRNFLDNDYVRNRGKFSQNRSGFYKKKRVIDLKQNLSMNKFSLRGTRVKNQSKGDLNHKNKARANYNDGRQNEMNVRSNQKGRHENKSRRSSNIVNKNSRGGGDKERYTGSSSSRKGYLSNNDSQDKKNYDSRDVRNYDSPNYNGGTSKDEFGENHFDTENKKSYFREEQLDYNQGYLTNDRENMNVNETGQQIIFIPNPDFHSNVDAYSNIINPDLGDNQGKMQQLPLHMLPQNMAPEGTQGSEQLIFIPFVNNQLQPDSAVPIQFNNEGQMVQHVGPDKIQHEKGMVAESKDQTKKTVKKGLSNEQRALMRKKLILKRRQRLEQEIEQKVLKKLLGTAGKLNLADTSNNLKKPLKRLSPPKKFIPNKKVTMKKTTSGLEDVSDDEADKYDDVSDLESISEDEDLAKQKGTPRKYFRKPGEPRVNRKSGIQTVNDVRRVVEKNVSQKVREAKEKAGEKVRRGRKRTVYEVHEDDKGKKKAVRTDGKKTERPGMSGKPSRVRRSMSPLQITVNNEKFSNTSRRPKSKSSCSREEEDEIQNRRKQREGSNDRNIKKRSRDYDDDDDDVSDDDYSDIDNDDDFDEINRGRQRSSRFYGKYKRKTGIMQHERERDSIKKDNNRDIGRRASSRDDDINSRRYQEDRRGYRRRNSPPRWQDNRNRDIMSQNLTNNNPQNFQYIAASNAQQQNQTIQAPPFQSALLTSQSQNVSIPVQSNISLVNTGNSVDPSLPPILNVPQLSQANVGMHPDMSLPPPQVSVMGNQSSIPQLSYQQSIQTQPLQNQILQQNQQLQQPTLQQQLQQTQLHQQQSQQQLLQLQQQQQQQQVLFNSNNQLNSSTVLNQSIYQQPAQQKSLETTSYSVPTQQTNLQTVRPIQSVQQSVNSQGNRVQVHNQQMNQVSLTTQLQSSQYSKGMSTVTQKTARPQQSKYKAVTGVIGTIAKGSNVQQQNMPQVNIPVAAIQPKPLLPTANNQNTGRVVGAQFKGESFVGNDSNTYRSRTGYDHSQINRSSVAGSQSGNYSNRVSSSGNHKQSDDRATSNRSSTYDRRGGNTQSRDPAGRSTQTTRPSTSYRRDAESESDDDDVGQLMCMKCDKVYLSKKVMRKHARWHDKVAVGQHDVRCDKCELAFLTTSLLGDHIAEKHTIDSWNCCLCNITFSHSSSLVRHFQRENHAYLTENKYRCPICSNEFATVKMLSHHKQTHQIVKHPTTRRY